MQEKDSAVCGSATSLEVRYTGKPVSGWGGLVAVMRYLENLGVGQVLAQALPDGRTSPNQIPVLDMVLAFFATVLTGGCRFAHVERLRTDEVVQAILGVKRMPSAMTLTRYFGGLVRSQIEHLSEVLWAIRVAPPACAGPGRGAGFGFHRVRALRAPAGQSQGLQSAQTRSSLPPSAARDVGRGQGGAARLAAQRQHRQRARG